MTQSQAVSVAPEVKVRSLRTFLSGKSVMDQLALAMPPHLTPERVVRQVMTLVQKTPRLLNCSQVSILSGMVQASELGLELSGPLGQAWLVPRWNKHTRCEEATFQIGYKGLISLAMRGGTVGNFSPRIVHEKDKFWYCFGTAQKIIHEPAEGDRGEPTHYYAVINYSNGGLDFEVMSALEVQAHRERFTKKGDGPSVWDSNFDAMALKTCIIKLGKRVPLTVEYAEVVAREIEADERYLEIGNHAAKDEESKPERGQEILDKIDAANPTTNLEADEVPPDEISQ